MVVIAIHQHESPMGAHVSLHPESPLPTSHPTLGCPRALALSALSILAQTHCSFIDKVIGAQQNAATCPGAVSGIVGIY